MWWWPKEEESKPPPDRASTSRQSTDIETETEIATEEYDDDENKKRESETPPIPFAQLRQKRQSVRFSAEDLRKNFPPPPPKVQASRAEFRRRSSDMTQSDSFLYTYVIRDQHFCTNLKVYVREFSETIEVHGLRYLFEEGRSIWERGFWVVVIMLSLATCIFLIMMVHQMYLHVPVMISFSSKDSSIYDVPFPAVTICPQGKTTGKYRFAELYKKFVKKSLTDAEEIKYFQYFNLVCDRTLHPRVISLAEGDAVDNVANNFYEIMKEISPKVDDIMYNCTFLDMVANCSDIFRRIYTDVGVCFSFNMVHWNSIYTSSAAFVPGFFEMASATSSWSALDGYTEGAKPETYPRRGLVPGAYNALNVYLKQSRDNLDAVCTTGIPGFKLNVHDPLQVPRFTKHHIHLGPDYSMMMKIDPVLTTVTDAVRNLSPENRQCYMSNEKKLRFFREYSRINCLTECLVEYTLKSCACVPFYLPRNHSTPICTISSQRCARLAADQIEMNVVKDILNLEDSNYDFQDTHLACDCPPFCNELKYSLSITGSDWEAAQKNAKFDVSLMTVFFRSNEFLKLEITEFYGIADLLANIGGLLNLFVGASVLTFCEIIYSFTLKIMCNKIIYGPWAGPAAVQYKR